MEAFDSVIADASVSVVENEKSKIYILRNETGEGLITVHEVLNGIYFLYGDCHMSSVVTDIHRRTNCWNCWALDYCYEGRIECSLPDGCFVYQKQGDLGMDNRKKTINSFFFPLGHYHSLSIVFFFPQAQESINASFPGFPIDMEKLRDKFLEHSYPCLIRNYPEVNNIFLALRDIKEDNKNTYSVVKTLELLLALNSIDIADVMNKDEYTYFHKTDVEKVKLIHRTMVEDLEHHYTLHELSEEFKISLTAMTNCFKGIYGKPINAYMREYKMNYAAKELLITELSIAKIGLLVGYTNPGKFSGAFKKVIGTLPKEYRKANGHKQNEKGL